MSRQNRETADVVQLARDPAAIVEFIARLRMADAACPGMLSGNGPMTEEDLDYITQTAENSDNVVLVVNGPDGMAGAVCWEPENEQDVLLTSLFCLPEYQGQRLGSQLLLAALELALGEGYGRVHLEVTAQNPEAQAWYARLGFSLVEGDDIPDSEYNTVEMELVGGRAIRQATELLSSAIIGDNHE